MPRVNTPVAHAPQLRDRGLGATVGDDGRVPQPAARLAALLGQEAVVARRQRRLELGIVGQAADPGGRIDDLLGDAEAVEVREPRGHVGQLLRRDRDPLLVGRLHRGGIGCRLAQLVVHDPDGIEIAEARIGGQGHGQRPARVERRIEVLPGGHGLLDVGIGVDDVHGDVTPASKRWPRLAYRATRRRGRRG
jgi:hypothetical protein